MRIPQRHSSVVNSRSVVSLTVSSLWFLQLYVPGVGCSASVPSRVFVMRSPLRLRVMPSAEGSFSHLRSLPTARPECPVPPVVESWHSEDSLYYPIQWVENKGWDNLRANLGFRVFWFIPPFCPSLSLDSLLYRVDFPRSTHGVGVA